LPVARTAIMAVSGTALDPSYIDALATSMPVNWQIIVWNSKIVVRIPCEISAWYGVYDVRNSPRDTTVSTITGR
jgi:hypothetical protein